MADDSVQLSDLYEPLTFNAGVDEAFVELNRFLTSGVMMTLDSLTAQASAGGSIGEMPFFKPLVTSSEPDYTNDDPTVNSEPDGIPTGKQIFRVAKMHQSWGTMDFATELGLSSMDPMSAITRKVGKWWAIQEEKRLIQSAMGMLADNIANDSSDMVVDIYSDIATPAATNIIAGTDIIDTMQTAGDHGAMFTAIAMHSVTHATLLKADLIDYIPDSEGKMTIQVYMGKIVVVDDSLPVIAGTNSPKYVTLLFSAGAFGFGSGRMLVPSEMDREASSGNGGGQDILHTRRNDIIQPAGFQFTSASVAAESATLAELATATNWDRVMERKNIGIAALYHNN